MGGWWVVGCAGLEMGWKEVGRMGKEGGGGACMHAYPHYHPPVQTEQRQDKDRTRAAPRVLMGKWAGTAMQGTHHGRGPARYCAMCSMGPLPWMPSPLPLLALPAPSPPGSATAAKHAERQISPVTSPSRSSSNQEGSR